MLYANSALTQLLGTSLAELQGKLLADALGVEAGREIGRLLSDARTTRHSREVRFPRGGELDLHFIAVASPLQLGTTSGHAVTFTNVTERVLNEGAQQSEHAARAEAEAGLAEVRAKLGPGGAIERAADIFARML